MNLNAPEYGYGDGGMPAYGDGGRRRRVGRPRKVKRSVGRPRKGGMTSDDFHSIYDSINAWNYAHPNSRPRMGHSASGYDTYDSRNFPAPTGGEGGYYIPHSRNTHTLETLKPASRRRLNSGRAVLEAMAQKMGATPAQALAWANAEELRPFRANKKSEMKRLRGMTFPKEKFVLRLKQPKKFVIRLKKQGSGIESLGYGDGIESLGYGGADYLGDGRRKRNPWISYMRKHKHERKATESWIDFIQRLSVQYHRDGN